MNNFLPVQAYICALIINQGVSSVGQSVPKAFGKVVGWDIFFGRDKIINGGLAQLARVSRKHSGRCLAKDWLFY